MRENDEGDFQFGNPIARIQLECQYIRNEITLTKFCKGGSVRLHRGDYSLNLTSASLLLSVAETQITIYPGELTKLTSPVGILFVKKVKEAGISGRRHTAQVTGDNGSSARFAIDEDTAKLLPVGSYKIELQEAGKNEKVIKDLIIQPGKITAIELD